MPPERIVVIGLPGDGATGLGKEARWALDGADLLVGGRRHIADIRATAARTAFIEGDIPAVIDAVAAEPGVACVLASGDPGFFGIVRPLAARFGRRRLEVHPVTSSVALAFARLGLSWDDAVIVSAHGRLLADAVDVILRAPKVAVLVSPDNPPELVGRALLEAGAAERTVAVCARLGLSDESVVETDLAGLAGGSWDPLSVVVVLAGDGVSRDKTLAWGLAQDRFSARQGLITKAEVRAVALGKLALPGSGVLWDLGAGSGSVGIECARLAPALTVYAVERSEKDAERIRANAAAHDVSVRVVAGDAVDVIAELPDPDRVFVGGGGLALLDAAVGRLRPDGRVVATYAALERAVAAADRLGSLVQVAVARGARLPDGGLRLAAENPVFVVWGPVE